MKRILHFFKSVWEFPCDHSVAAGIISYMLPVTALIVAIVAFIKSGAGQ